MPPRLTFFTRSYCHLCADMLAAMEPLRAEFQFEIDLIDIDTDPVLSERYNEWVPVLYAGEQELCHYFLDEPKVREYLGQFR